MLRTNAASSAKQLSAQVLCTSAALMREHVLPALSFGKTEKFDKCCAGVTPNGGRAQIHKFRALHVNFKSHSIMALQTAKVLVAAFDARSTV